jgi:membrane protease YdiL (CAAX protease family)
METADSIRKRIITFLLLTFAFSSVYYYLIISAGTLLAGKGLYVLGLMWCPGIAALITQFIYQKNLRGLGWGWGKTKYQLWSYAIPFLYAFVAYAIVWATGLGGFYNAEFVSKLAARLGRPDWATQMPLAVIALSFLLAGTLGMVFSCISALGEEIGWRGFFVPHLAKQTTFTKTALISGIVWSVWHYPILLFADYNSGTPAGYGLLCFTVMVMGISFAFAWMRLKSGSLWTGMLLHASHNDFIQGMFDPLTKDTGITRYIIGEFGAALAVISIVLGYIFWRKRAELKTTHIQEVQTPEIQAAVTKAI